jgi:hypothetical protein
VAFKKARTGSDVAGICEKLILAGPTAAIVIPLEEEEERSIRAPK